MTNSYPYPSSPDVSAVMQANKRRDTKPELRIRSALHARGHRYRVDFPIPLGGGRRVRPDIVFTRRGVAVFVDGCFWHRCPSHGNLPRANTEYWEPKLNRNVQRDRHAAQNLEAMGWTVVRIWEHSGIDEAVNVIEAELARCG